MNYTFSSSSFGRQLENAIAAAPTMPVLSLMVGMICVSGPRMAGVLRASRPFSSLVNSSFPKKFVVRPASTKSEISRV